MTQITIRPAKNDRHGIEGGLGFMVETPVGKFFRESLELARTTAEAQSKAHGLPVVEVAK